MKYTVTWLPAASSELTRLYNQPLNRQAVADAADLIDQELKIDPDQKARLFGGMYFYRVPPLVVAFEVIPDDCLVRVLQVYRVKS
ncbi:MAG TPA: hypothetical protein VN688_30980 [Gemmataceae bacterium]|nr:hypothetical protein [Gemmataceae bacterium]